jgi:hypothetical protein
LDSLSRYTNESEGEASMDKLSKEELRLLLRIAGDNEDVPGVSWIQDAAGAESLMQGGFKLRLRGYVESPPVDMPLPFVLTERGLAALEQIGVTVTAARAVTTTARQCARDLQSVLAKEGEEVDQWLQEWACNTGRDLIPADGFHVHRSCRRVVYRRVLRLDAQRRLWAAVAEVEALMLAELNADLCTGLIPADADVTALNPALLLRQAIDGNAPAAQALATLLGVDLLEGQPRYQREQDIAAALRAQRDEIETMLDAAGQAQAAEMVREHRS